MTVDDEEGLARAVASAGLSIPADRRDAMLAAYRTVRQWRDLVSRHAPSPAVEPAAIYDLGSLLRHS